MAVIGVDPLQMEGQQAVEEAAARGPQRRFQGQGGAGQQQADRSGCAAAKQGPADRTQPQLGTVLAQIGGGHGHVDPPGGCLRWAIMPG